MEGSWGKSTGRRFEICCGLHERAQRRSARRPWRRPTQRVSGPGIGVSPYHRLNRVRLDLGESVIEARFVVCSDLWALTRLPPKGRYT